MSKTQKFPLPVTGIDSLSEETALIKGAVREAVNVDINRSGGFARRKGYTQLLAANDLHSLHTAVQRGVTYLAHGSLLMSVNPPAALAPVGVLNSSDPVSYVEYNGNVYASNKTSLLWLPADSPSQFRPVGVPTPDAPTLSVANGGLLPGKYGVTISMVDDRGEESGTAPVQILDLPDGGGVSLSRLPQKSGYTVFVYMTAADGEQLHLAAQCPAVFPTYVVGETAKGGDCDTRGLQPMPPGDFVRWLGGRLFTAKNGAVYFSEAMRPHLHNPAHNVIPMSGHISFMEAVIGGLYVGDSRGVWYFDGTDPTVFKALLVSTCRAVVRSSIMVPPEHFNEKLVPSKNPVALWLSTSGYVVGMENGQTVELQPERVKVPPGLAGRSVYLFRNGRKQVLTPVNSPSVYANGIAEDSVIDGSTPLPSTQVAAPLGVFPGPNGVPSVSAMAPSQSLAPSGLPPTFTAGAAAVTARKSLTVAGIAAGVAGSPSAKGSNILLPPTFGAAAYGAPAAKGLNLLLPPTFGAAAYGGAAIAHVTPPAENLVSHMKFLGADGSTTFTDETGRGWNTQGDAQIDDTVTAFGKAPALYLPTGATGGCTDTNISLAAFAPGTGDFTLQFWCAQSAESTLYDTLNGFLVCVKSADGGGFFLYDNQSEFWPQFSQTGTGINVFDGLGHYFCIQRTSGVMHGWLDTKYVAPDTPTSAHDFSNVPTSVTLGRRAAASSIRPALSRMWGFKLQMSSLHTPSADLGAIPSPLT
jgi:hypothetical protein